MPVVSQAQNAAMHSASEGHSTIGIPQKVGAEFIADQKPGSVKRLPKRVSPHHEVKHVLHHAAKLAKRGAISEAEHRKIRDKAKSISGNYGKSSAGDTDELNATGNME